MRGSLVTWLVCVACHTLTLHTCTGGRNVPPFLSPTQTYRKINFCIFSGRIKLPSLIANVLWFEFSLPFSVPNGSPATWLEVGGFCFLNITSIPLLMMDASPTSLSKFICSSVLKPYVPPSVKFSQISLRHLFSLRISTDMDLAIFGEDCKSDLTPESKFSCVSFGWLIKRVPLLHALSPCSTDSNPTLSGFCKANIKTLVLYLGHSQHSVKVIFQSLNVSHIQNHFPVDWIWTFFHQILWLLHLPPLHVC